MMALAEAKQMLSAELSGGDVNFDSVSTDTRTLVPGALYFALQGDRFDGHDYLEQAQTAGAVAAVVHKHVDTQMPVLRVEDTRKALGQLAAGWRSKYKGKLVGITGSNGKTTVKEMTAAILKESGNVLATRGNFNNDIGMPLTLLGLQNEDYAVIEMGANHHGEIAYLTDIARPDVAVITNAGPAHLDGFGSIKGVAEAKGEIYNGLTEDGVAIINLDDDYSGYWLECCKKHTCMTFSSMHESATVFGKVTKHQGITELEVKVSTQNYTDENLKIQLQVPGQHNVMNALAAITVAVAFEVPGDRIVQALNAFKSVKGRLNIHKVSDALTVIDDTYNANPASLKAGVEVLKELPGEHWLVLGDMGELGGEERRLHFDAGIQARTSGVSRLLAIGDASQHAVDAFGASAVHFKDKQALLEYIESNRPEELGLLVKGSRFMQMEDVVNALIKGDG